MQKILLVAINAKYIHSNLAVYSLKAYCDNQLKSDSKKFEVKIKEFTINNMLDDIVNGIYLEKPDVIAFSVYIWNISYVEMLLKEIGKILPNCKIWLGGPEVSYRAKELLDLYSDVELVMRGEGERTFTSLVRAKYNQNALTSDIKGITYREYTGKIIQNEDLDIMDLSDVPFVYNNILDFENRIIYYETSRGCPFSCSYCLSSVEKSVRFRDIEIVKKELKFFLDNNVPQVKFVDRTFNCKKSHALEIWKFIKENDNGITNFHFEVAADLLDETEIELLSSLRVGLVQLEIGVQSTNLNTIKEIKRTMDIDKLKYVVSKINEAANIHQHLDLIVGLPYEDFASFKNSFNDVYKMQPEQLQLGFLKVLSGSYMSEMQKDYGLVYKSYAPYEVMSTKWISFDEILTLKSVEEMVEIYYNTGQFVYTIKYLENLYEQPFDMFLDIGTYYAKHFEKSAKHSRIDRYNILLRFVEERKIGNIGFFKQLMTFDIYLRENIKTRPAFSRDLREFSDDIHKLKEENNLTRLEHVEVISADVLKYLEDKECTIDNSISSIEGTEYYLLFDYNKRNPLNHNAKVSVLK